MRFIFTERKVNISDELRAYAEKKLSKLDRYFKNEAIATVTVGKERGRDWLEVTVKYEGMLFRATERSDDLHQAIDAVEATIDRQIRKNKTRLERRFREGVIRFDAALDASQEPVVEETEFDIVRTKRFPVKPMAVEEAILQMNLLNHMFFVFRNMTNDAFSVVYQRNGGGYGLIESIEE